MYFRDIVGQQTAKDELIRATRAGVIPHARLFVGESGTGALALAYAYARYINCHAPSVTDACGHCRSCLQYDQYALPDLHFLFPIVNVGSRNLCDDELESWRRFLSQGAHTTYDDWLEVLGGDGKKLGIFAREGALLAEKLSYKVSEAHYRVLLIWMPERMNETLGNKLLKLTEEPPEQTIILMVSHDEREVLPTLRSRLQTLHLRPLSEREIVQALQTTLSARTDESPEEALHSAAHLSNGNYRRALDYYQGKDEAGQEHRARLGNILRMTIKGKPVDMRLLADELANLGREEQLSLLEYMASMMREFYMYGLALPDISYMRPSERIIAQTLEGCITGRNIRAVQEELDLAQRHIQQNVNARMVFFDLILRLTSTLSPAYRERGLKQ